jgi:hypothetical protein
MREHVLRSHGHERTSEVKTKTCVDCKKRQPVDNFYRLSKHGDGTLRQSRCKPCDNAKRAGNVKRASDGSRVIVTRQPDGTLRMSHVAATAGRSGSVDR